MYRETTTQLEDPDEFERIPQVNRFYPPPYGAPRSAMKIYRVVTRTYGASDWEQVGRPYIEERIAKGQKTRLENDMKRLYGSPRYEHRAYKVQVAEVGDWVVTI